MTWRLKQHGMTIPELLVAMTVTVIMVTVISGFMLDNMQQSTIAEAKAKILHETQLSLDLVSDDVRLSANADLNNRWPDNNGPGGVSNPYSWTSNSSTMVVATSAENTAGDIIFSDPNNYITEKNNLVYFVQNGTLYKRTIASPVAGNSEKTSCPAASASTACPKDKQLLSNVTAFTITYLDGYNQPVTPTDARSVEINIQVTKNVYKRDLTADYTTRMVFRND